jgi:hypothetical protein
VAQSSSFLRLYNFAHRSFCASPTISLLQKQRKLMLDIRTPSQLPTNIRTKSAVCRHLGNRSRDCDESVNAFSELRLSSSTASTNLVKASTIAVFQTFNNQRSYSVMMVIGETGASALRPVRGSSRQVCLYLYCHSHVAGYAVSAVD